MASLRGEELALAPQEAPSRLPWIDVLRVVAALCVVVLHVSDFTLAVTPSSLSLNWLVAALFRCSATWGVPVFVLISGALLLEAGKEESYGAFLRRRASRIAAPFLFWSALYIALPALRDGINWRRAAYVLLHGRPAFHMWYLYVAAGLYLFTPFLRTCVKAASHREKWLLVVLLFLAAGVSEARPVAACLKPWRSILTMFIPFLPYYLCGHQLRQGTPRRAPLGILWCIVLGCALVISAQYVAERAVQNSAALGPIPLTEPFSPTVVLSAAAVFLLVKGAWSGTPSRGGRIVTLCERVAPATLGIYLVHPLIMSGLKEATGLTSATLPALVWIPLMSAATFLLSLGVIAVVRRVPYVRRIA